MESPLISVIIPVYNAEKYLPRCIRSVVNQSEKELELILVNDFSTDNSFQIMEEAMNRYHFVKSINAIKKGSAGGARNVGLNIAKGKYVSFLDNDDWIDSNMYKKCVQLLEKNNADISVCGILTEYLSPFESSNRYEYEIENTIEGAFALELMCKQYNQDVSMSPLVGNKVYRRDFLDTHKLKFVENCYNDDDVFNYLSFLSAEKVVVTPNTYLHYYQHEDSITHSFSKRHIDDLITAFRIIKSALEERGLYQSQMINYYPFFEKCLSFVLNILFATEPNKKVQNDYLKYFYLQCNEILTTSEYVEYLGLPRIRRFLNPRL